MCVCVQMASQENGYEERLVIEIPRPTASQAFDASKKLYRFINSSGNYAAVMATVSTVSLLHTVAGPQCSPGWLSSSCRLWLWIAACL